MISVSFSLSQERRGQGAGNRDTFRLTSLEGVVKPVWVKARLRLKCSFLRISRQCVKIAKASAIKVIPWKFVTGGYPSLKFWILPYRRRWNFFPVKKPFSASSGFSMMSDLDISVLGSHQVHCPAEKHSGLNCHILLQKRM